VSRTKIYWSSFDWYFFANTENLPGIEVYKRVSSIVWYITKKLLQKTLMKQCCLSRVWVEGKEHWLTANIILRIFILWLPTYAHYNASLMLACNYIHATILYNASQHPHHLWCYFIANPTNKRHINLKKVVGVYVYNDLTAAAYLFTIQDRRAYCKDWKSITQLLGRHIHKKLCTWLCICPSMTSCSLQLTKKMVLLLKRRESEEYACK